MDVFEAIYGRCSVRDFKSRQNIPSEIVEKLLKAACESPSAGNIQPWRFWVVRDEMLKSQLAQAAHGQSFIAEASVVIVVCADLDASAQRYGVRGRGLYAIQDTAAATQSLLLAAYAEGLGACWVGAFEESMVGQILKLSDAVRPVVIVPVGYPASSSCKPARKDYREVTECI
jgi:nitroreductase